MNTLTLFPWDDDDIIDFEGDEHLARDIGVFIADLQRVLMAEKE